MAPWPDAVRAPAPRRLPGLSTAIGAAVVLWGLADGLARLHDNSFFTHLATGRIVLAHGVPGADPYSFTAHGHPWVVESWLASVLYAVVEKAGGAHGLQLLHAALCAVLGALVWLLTRPARQLAGRLVAAGAALVAGTGYWSPRPLLLALVLFGLLVLMAETGARRPWLAVPLMWVWVDVHGSWPFAFAYLALRLVGRRLDGQDSGGLLRLALAVATGTALAAANPVGPRLLAYPLVLITHHQAFAHVAEWQAPSFADPVNAVFLGALVLSFVLAAVRRHSTEDVVVVLGFAAGALIAARNVPVAALVITPILARGLTGLGSVRGERRGAAAAGALALLTLVGGLLVARALEHPAYDLSAYPVAEVSWMQQRGLVPGRVATPDYVGNYLELRYGTRAMAFIDDRVDMYPLALERGYETLLAGRPGWQAVLDRYRVEAVLWPRGDKLSRLVARSRAWSVVHADRHWVVAVRRPAPALIVTPAHTRIAAPT